MENLQIVIQLIIALGIFNVWIIRINKPSKYRGGNSKNMESEFKIYGFSNLVMKIIGFSKLSLAFLLIYEKNHKVPNLLCRIYLP